MNVLKGGCHMGNRTRNRGMEPETVNLELGVHSAI